MPEGKQIHCFLYAVKSKSKNDNKCRPHDQYSKVYSLFSINSASGTDSDSNSLIKNSAKKDLLLEWTCHVFCPTCGLVSRLCCKRISVWQRWIGHRAIGPRPLGIFSSSVITRASSPTTTKSEDISWSFWKA